MSGTDPEVASSATSPPPAPVAPTVRQKLAERRKLTERSAPLAVSILAALVGAPRPILTLLVITSMAVTAILAFRHWRRSVLDGVLLLAGALLSGAVLTGFVLDVVPGGLTTRSWIIAAAVVEFVVVVATIDTPLDLRPGRAAFRLKIRELLAFAPPRKVSWYAGGAGLVVLAFVLSVTAEIHSDRAPLALSVQGESTRSATLAVTSGSAAGPLLLVEDLGKTQRVLRSDVTVRAGHPFLLSVSPPAGRSTNFRLLMADVFPPDQLAEVTVLLPRAT